MLNYDHNHPHMIKSIQKPTNQRRSDLLNAMQDSFNCAHNMRPQRSHYYRDALNTTHEAVNSSLLHHRSNYCGTASAESSTRSPPVANNTAEALKTAKISCNPSSGAPIDRSRALNLKLKKSKPKDVLTDSATNVCGSNNNSVITTATINPVISSKLEGRIMNEELICDGNHEAIKLGSASEEDVVCSMCGDVGIAELLFFCTKCAERRQHIYCSRSYPNVSESEASVCNWCLHAKDAGAAKATGTGMDVRIEQDSTPRLNFEHSMISQIHEEQLGDHVMKEDNDAMPKKGHSKAFEYLLLVVAQSLPHDNQEIRETNPENGQADLGTSTITVKRDSSAVGKGASNTEMSIKANTTPLVNIVNIGPVMEAGKTNTSLLNNRLSCTIRMDNNQDTKIHGQLKISVSHKNEMVVGRLIGSSIPKRQRCATKGVNTPLKCRKKGLQLSPSRPNYPRYKLLADVVC